MDTESAITFKKAARGAILPLSVCCYATSQLCKPIIILAIDYSRLLAMLTISLLQTQFVAICLRELLFSLNVYTILQNFTQIIGLLRSINFYVPDLPGVYIFLFKNNYTGKHQGWKKTNVLKYFLVFGLLWF